MSNKYTAVWFADFVVCIAAWCAMIYWREGSVIFATDSILAGIGFSIFAASMITELLYWSCEQ